MALWMFQRGPWGAALVGLGCWAATVAAASWEPVTGAAQLRALIADSEVRFEQSPGDWFSGRYLADGTAVVRAYEGKFYRTWDIVGDDQVCYYADRDSHCYRLFVDSEDPQSYRAVREDGEEVLFHFTESGQAVIASDEADLESGSIGEPSASELAAELANPNTTLGTMNFFLDYSEFKGDLPGARGASATTLSFQPALPYPVSETANLFVRPLVPIVLSRDVPTPEGFESVGVDLGDISYDVSVFNSFSGGYVLGGGLSGTIPTATDDNAGIDQWLLGPAVLAAMVRPWGVVGAIVSHQWDIAGDDDFDTEVTGGQYFYSYALDDGWQLGAGPVFSYNHEASSGNKWTFPLGVGVNRTVFLGRVPWRFGVQYWHYVEQADVFGPDFQIRLQFSPVVPLPW